MSKKPQISADEIREILAANKVTDKVCLIGIRGYYLDSMGKPGENDRGIYDDAIIIISPREYETFQANTDPSIYRKAIASMIAGVCRYYKGKHKNRYWALRLVGEKVKVTRDKMLGILIGIALNIHKGGWRSTGSEGCQTLMPNDWDDFIELVYDEMDFYGQETIPYVLIDEKDRRAGKFKMPHLENLNISDEEIDVLLDSVSAVEPQTSDVQQLPVQSVEKPSISANAPQNATQLPITEDAETADKLDLGGYVKKAQEAAAKATGAIETIQIFKDALDETPRSDSRKSLWTTIGNAFYQMLWAIVAFFIGLPVEVWLVVAIIAAIVGVMYLYRQNSLGKIRETARLKFLEIAAIFK